MRHLFCGAYFNYCTWVKAAWLCPHKGLLTQLCTWNVFLVFRKEYLILLSLRARAMRSRTSNHEEKTRDLAPGSPISMFFRRRVTPIIFVEWLPWKGGEGGWECSSQSCTSNKQLCAIVCDCALLSANLVYWLLLSVIVGTFEHPLQLHWREEGSGGGGGGGGLCSPAVRLYYNHKRSSSYMYMYATTMTLKCGGGRSLLSSSTVVLQS